MTGRKQDGQVDSLFPPDSRTAPQPAGQPLGTIGRFRLVAELGRGGMGTVYRAADQVTGQQVALKVLELATDTTVALFEREYQTLASIDHPCVPKVYDFGVGENDCRYYTMTLIEGQDMHGLAPMPWREVCRHLRDVGMALACLHVRGLLHRDISPRNIRIDDHGRAKLIDFGALAPFGLAQQLVGTPACSAPEPLRRVPLDQRADLFSLGATAYMALTRKRPFPIKRWSDAEAGWQIPPAPPSEIVAGLPQELDQLILSLLQLDKRARPESVADVIERLERIAGIEDEIPTLAQSAPLASGGLVGRDVEQGQLLAGLEQALQGRGGAWTLEGPARSGRSRLAHELAIAARLRGAIAVTTAGAGPLRSGSVVQALMRTLAQAAPAEVSACLRAKPFLLDNFPELKALAGGAGPVGSVGGRGRDGFAAVPAFMARLATQRPILVVVDDINALDQISAGTLMAISMLAQSRPLMVLLILNEQAPLPGATRQLVQSSEVVSVGAFSTDKTVALVESVFGKVEHGARLAQWLHQVAGGNVGHSLDLLRDLIDRGVIRRLSGSWTLPQDLMGQELPENLAEALRLRLHGLSRVATELGRALALYGVSATTGLCERMLPERPAMRVHRALGELSVRQVVTAVGGRYRLPLPELCAELLDPLTASETRELHARVGVALVAELEELLAAEPGPEPLLVEGLRFRAGFHLLCAGDDRGTQLLMSAAIYLTHRGEGLVELVPTLESALQILDDRGEQTQRFPLIAPLIIAGTYLDHRLTYRYGDELLEVMSKQTGMALALRLRRFLPRFLALALGLLCAGVRFTWSAPRALGHTFREIMLGLVGLSSAVLGTYAALVDAGHARRVLDRIAGLGLFPRRHPVALVYRFQCALYDVAQGEYGAATSKALSALSALSAPRLETAMPEGARHQFLHGLYVVLGSIACYRSDAQVGQWLSELDRLPLAQARASAAGIRANFHANRGEMRHSVHYRGLVDSFAAQSGASWQQDLLIPRCLWWIEVQCEDALGLRRTLRKIEPMATEGTPLATVYAAAHACYMAERGLHREALVRYGPLLEEATQTVSVYGLRLVGAYARLLRIAGQAERARVLCEAALGRIRPDDLELTCLVHGVELERAYALLTLGHVDAAADAASALARAQVDHDNPLLHALTQRLLAQVALAQNEQPRFVAALASMETWCRRAENPALFRLLQQLRSEQRSASSGGAESAAISSAPGDSQLDLRSLVAALSACDSAGSCGETAVRWLAEYSRAAGGAIYIANTDQPPQLVALRGEIEVPATVCAALEVQRVQWNVAQHSLAPTQVGSASRQSGRSPPAATTQTELNGYHISPLLASQGLGGDLVGFVVLRIGDGRLKPLPWEALRAVSDALQLIVG